MNITLLNAVTTTGAGPTVKGPRGRNAFQARLNGTGTVTITARIEVSNDGVDWFTFGTITLNGAAPQTDGAGVPLNGPVWHYARGNVVSISGTGAAFTLTMSDET